MKIDFEEHVRVDASKRERPTRGLLLLAILLAVGVTGCTVFLLTARFFDRSRILAWAELRGHTIMYNTTSLTRAVMQAPLRWLKSVTANIDVPELVLDIKFVDLQKLSQKRDEALAKGFIIKEDDDFVPASIRTEGRTVKVELRLKGDLVDHIITDKWSFRIKVKGTDQVFGMREFSIQHPGTRAFQAEALFLSHLRELGILAPRYSFVNVTVNGKRVGLMALEESFSKELLESQGRRESVILKFDESLFWEEWMLRGQKGIVFNSFRNADIDTFQSADVAKSEQLSRDAAIAIGLMRGFVDGTLKPSEVFDVERMGTFLAAAEIWGAQHGLFWNNMRFSYNPISAKLEPVAYDCFRMRIADSIVQWVSQEEPIIRNLLGDPRIFSAYIETIKALAGEIKSGELQKKYRVKEREYLSILQREFYFIEGFPFEQLGVRVRILRGLTDGNPESYAEMAAASAPQDDVDALPSIVHARLLTDADGSCLEISNAVPHHVQVHSIRWVAQDGAALDAIDSKPPITYPISLEPTRLGSLPRVYRIDLEKRNDGNPTRLLVEASVEGSSRQFTTDAQPYFNSLAANPIPVASVSDQLRRHPFLRMGESPRTLSVTPGRWKVKGMLVVPEGFSLVISPGTTLQFEPGGLLMARGPLQFSGSDAEPIRLEGPASGGDAAKWQGIVVLEADGASRWSHVTVRGTMGIEHPDWRLTGGVTFYRSDITMDHCSLLEHGGEDALNIVQSRFLLRDVEIADTASDGLDSDFSEGRIEGGACSNIGASGGGDGMDFSGSTVSITGTKFRDISDKAISVGENSDVTVAGVEIERVGAGLACKDASTTRVSDSSITAAGIAGLMAYVKKEEYGPARIVAQGIRFAGEGRPAIAQIGSSIILENEAVKEEEVDVDMLYETEMKPGLR